MFNDPHASKIGMDSQSYLGDLIAFLGASGWAIYAYLAKRNKIKIHPFVTATYMFFFWWIHQFIFFPYFSSSSCFFSFDIEYGAFGWLVDSKSLILVKLNFMY